MKERPILYTGSNVRAVEEEYKTQTRRVVKMHKDCHADPDLSPTPDGMDLYVEDYPEEGVIGIKCPYGLPGDRLWVRENFYCDYLLVASGGKLPKEEPEWAKGNMYFAADGTCCQQIPECACSEVGKVKWRPSIHMPRWASRLLLEVVSVRVERLQDISAQDAIAEGIRLVAGSIPGRWTYGGTSFIYETPQEAYRNLWESIHGKGSWDANPFVWVVTFKLIERKAW